MDIYARQPGTVFKRLNAQQSEILTEFSRKALFKILRVFDLCLEMPSESKSYFGFAVDEFYQLSEKKMRAPDISGRFEKIYTVYRPCAITSPKRLLSDFLS